MSVGANIQMRPREGNPDRRFYSPNRDIAYIYISMCKEALKGLDVSRWEDWFGDYLRLTKTTPEQIGEGAKRFAEAHNLFTKTDQITVPTEALRAAGFYQLPYPVQIGIFARLGFITMGTYFMGIRDVTEYNGVPPVQLQIDEMVAGGRSVAEAFATLALPPPLVRPDQEELQRQMDKAQAAVDHAQAAVDRATGLSWELSRTKHQLALYEKRVSWISLLSLRVSWVAAGALAAGAVGGAFVGWLLHYVM